MAIRLEDVVEEYKQATAAWEDGMVVDAAIEVLARLLLNSLGPQHRRVFDMLHPLKAVTSREVACALQISQQNAANLLRYLHKIHLARRELEVTDQGIRYLWYNNVFSR
jgi:transcription initiation factor IIE alpha subunit